MAAPGIRELLECSEMATDTLEFPSAAGSPAPAPNETVKTPNSRSAQYTIAAAAVTVLAAVLRFYGIAFKSFWVDETMSVEIARLPLRALLHLIWIRETNMAPYYLLLHYWLQLRNTDAFVRGLSALFSVATFPFFYALGVRLFNRQVALVGAFLLSIHAYHVRYAQEVRSYSMAVFLCVVASWLFVKNLQEPESSRWGAYAVVCGLATYAHFYAGLVVLAHWASLLALPPREVPWKSVFKSALLYGVLVAPIPILIAKIGRAPIEWLPPFNLNSLPVLGREYSGNVGQPLLQILVLLALAFAIRYAFQFPGRDFRPGGGYSYAFLLAWLFLPIALIVAVSFMHPLLVNRFMSPILPAFVLLVASQIVALRPAPLKWFAFAMISALMIQGTLNYYREDFDANRQDWRAAESYVMQHGKPGDSVFFYSWAGISPFEYYQSQRTPKPEWPKLLNPPDRLDRIGPQYELIPGTDIYALPVEGTRVWLVLLLPLKRDGSADQLTDYKVRDWFAAGRHRIDVKRLYPINIVLFESDSVPSPTFHP